MCIGERHSIQCAGDGLRRWPQLLLVPTPGQQSGRGDTHLLRTGVSLPREAHQDISAAAVLPVPPLPAH